MNRLLRTLSVTGLLAWAPLAQAMYFAYLPGPGAAWLPINQIGFPILNVDAGCCGYLDTTFDVHSRLSWGIGGLQTTEVLDATLTTDAQGQVLAWQVSGYNATRYRTISYASSSQAGPFSEWLQLTSFYGWTPEGPAYSSGPGTWRMSAMPIPEPGSAALLAAGLVALVAVPALATAGGRAQRPRARRLR